MRGIALLAESVLCCKDCDKLQKRYRYFVHGSACVETAYVPILISMKYRYHISHPTRICLINFIARNTSAVSRSRPAADATRTVHRRRAISKSGRVIERTRLDGVNQSTSIIASCPLIVGGLFFEGATGNRQHVNVFKRQKTDKPKIQIGVMKRACRSLRRRVSSDNLPIEMRSRRRARPRRPPPPPHPDKAIFSRLA
ncbi:hypothetical protein EVAR_96915_1 [Eumeta japonica]|uniref:Uncharacterized protein n=1 Tax=Eumeta variegata TaxID=151549 RepID=A0A4C1WFH9_EUMVA|nr:hypothetical protein EVAR_96915_1 [Eumeta japonica]